MLVQYRSWIAGFFRNLGAVAAGLAVGALVSFAIIRHAQYVSEDNALDMILLFPGMIAGYATGRLSHRWSPLWAYLVSFPLALFLGNAVADTCYPDIELWSVTTTGLVAGILAAFRSPRARRVWDRIMLVLAGIFVILCVPPIVMTAWRFDTFDTAVLPKIIREVNGSVIVLSDRPSVRVSPDYQVFHDSGTGWARFTGTVGKVRLSGWLDKRGEWVLGFAFRFEPDQRKLRKIDDLQSARAYARSMGMKEHVVRRLQREYARQGSYVDAYGAALRLADSPKLPHFEHPAASHVSVYRDGTVELTAGTECY